MTTITLKNKSGRNLFKHTKPRNSVRATLSLAVRKGVDLSQLSLHGEDLSGISLTDAKLNGARITACDLSRVKIKGGSFIGADFKYSSFDRVNIWHASFIAADFHRTTFTVHEASFSDFESANFSSADLRNVNFYRNGMEGAKLVNANCEGATFDMCRTLEIDAENANFTRATIKSPMCDVSLINADFTDARLFTDFSKSNLEGAKLVNVKINDVAFTKTNVSDADFGPYGKVKGNRVHMYGPVGSRNAILQMFRTNLGTMFHTGCFIGNEHQLIAAVRAKHKGWNNRHRAGYTKAIEILKGMNA